MVKAITHMTANKQEWYFLKEENPLKYTEYLARVVDRIRGHKLGELQEYTLWIKSGSYYHMSILRRSELDSCPHLNTCLNPAVRHIGRMKPPWTLM